MQGQQDPAGLIVVGRPDGPAQGARDAAAAGDVAQGEVAGVAPGVDTIEHPAKLLRIATMVRQLLEEVRSAPLDESGRRRLQEIYERSVRELGNVLSDDLRAELAALTLPFEAGEVASESELRIAQAQLVGWLEGLFRGMQAALSAQALAAQAQFEEMRRRGLPVPGGPTEQPGRGDGAPPGYL